MSVILFVVGLRGAKHLSGKEEAHINVNKFWGLSREWLGVKFCLCAFGSFLMGEKKHINKIPPAPKTPGQFRLCPLIPRVHLSARNRVIAICGLESQITTDSSSETSSVLSLLLHFVMGFNHESCTFGRGYSERQGEGGEED